MLEHGAVLETWAIDMPIQVGVDMVSRKLPDHRLAYLDYEGEVSGGRGEVSRYDRGAFESLDWTEKLVRVKLRGGRFLVNVEIRSLEIERDEAEGAPTWKIRFEE